MNKRQKVILIEFITVMLVTAVAVVAMINVKDWVNRSEAMRAMKQLSERVLEHRKVYGSIPSESYVDNIKESLEGHVRLGNLQYRARWIDFESTADEILAYAERNHPYSLLKDGFVVLRLDGRVEWMGKQEFEKILALQQSREEIEILQK